MERSIKNVEGDFFSSIKQRKLTYQRHFNCQSTYCVYALTCNHCKLKYIGESLQTISHRFRTYESHNKSKHSSPGAQHFTEERLDAKNYTL